MRLRSPGMSDRVWQERRAVVEYERGAECEGGDHPVPHHPAGRRVVQQHVGGGPVALDLQGYGRKIWSAYIVATGHIWSL